MTPLLQAKPLNLQNNRCKKTNNIAPSDVFVGVDVGKGHHHAVALDRNGKRLYNKALPNPRRQNSCRVA
ncbi:Ethanolamine utilization protein EutJ (predicted chaperonin) [Paraburkholderia sp. JPY681]|nr:Ethanolamine utilization protein EutJ (predicted chaperonin) [Paraburkholderia atlantica]